MALSKGGSAAAGIGMTGNREDVIETLIDMDPCGAAYRVSKTMVRVLFYHTVIYAFVVSLFMLTPL
jgi:hypothetical protein